MDKGKDKVLDNRPHTVEQKMGHLQDQIDDLANKYRSVVAELGEEQLRHLQDQVDDLTNQHNDAMKEIGEVPLLHLQNPQKRSKHEIVGGKDRGRNLGYFRIYSFESIFHLLVQKATINVIYRLH